MSVTISRRLCRWIFNDDTQSICSRAYEKDWRLFIAFMDLFEKGHCRRVYDHYHKD